MNATNVDGVTDTDGERVNGNRVMGATGCEYEDEDRAVGNDVGY